MREREREINTIRVAVLVFLEPKAPQYMNHIELIEDRPWRWIRLFLGCWSVNRVNSVVNTVVIHVDELDA